MRQALQSTCQQFTEYPLDCPRQVCEIMANGYLKSCVIHSIPHCLYILLSARSNLYKHKLELC